MIESWDWLIQLIEAGSFTRASERLHISQQTLSSRVASLEKELGTKLVVRSSPLSLTRAGEAFLSYAYEQKEALSVMLRRIGETTAGGTGQLKVGASHVRSRVLMPLVISQFRRSMPGVSVKLIEGTNEELVDLAEQGGADLVIARFSGDYPGVIVRPLFQEEVVFAIAPALLEEVTGLDAPEAAARAEREGLGILKECPLLVTSLDDITGRVARNELRAARVNPNVAVQSESMMTLLSMCSVGLGGVFCPTHILDAEAGAHDLVRIRLSDAARYEISIGRQKGAEPWTAAQLFEDIAGALYGDERAAR